MRRPNEHELKLQYHSGEPGALFRLTECLGIRAGSFPLALEIGQGAAHASQHHWSTHRFLVLLKIPTVGPISSLLPSTATHGILPPSNQTDAAGVLINDKQIDLEYRYKYTFKQIYW